MLKRLFQMLIDSRQRQVEREIAVYLAREYPSESHEYLLDMIRKGKTHEIPN